MKGTIALFSKTKKQIRFKRSARKSAPPRKPQSLEAYLASFPKKERLI